jgi:hypothetical protein
MHKHSSAKILLKFFKNRKKESEAWIEEIIDKKELKKILD